MQEPEDKQSLGDIVKDAATQPLHVPFSRRAQDAQGHPVNTTRIVEAVLIAAICSLGTYIVSIPKLEQKLENQSEQIRELRKSIDDMRHDFYTPFGRDAIKKGIDGNG